MLTLPWPEENDSFIFSRPPALRTTWVGMGSPGPAASEPSRLPRSQKVGCLPGGPNPPRTPPSSSRKGPQPPTAEHVCAQSRAPSFPRREVPAARAPALPPRGSSPGDTEGDGGLQKSSNSELRSQTLPAQLPGDAEAPSGVPVRCDAGDKRLPGSAFTPAAPGVLSAGRRRQGAQAGPGRPPLPPDPARTRPDGSGDEGREAGEPRR